MSIRSRRWSGVVVAAAAIGLATLVVRSSFQETTPTGITPGETEQGAAARRGDPISLDLRDIGGKRVRIPDRHPGLILFFESQGCGGCAPQAAMLSRLEKRVSGPLDLLAVDLESSDNREDVAGFRAASMAPDLPVALDTRLGALAVYFGVPTFGQVIVYGADGRIVDRLAPFPSGAEVRRALARAGVRTSAGPSPSGDAASASLRSEGATPHRAQARIARDASARG